MFGGYAFKKEHKLPSPPMGSGNAPIKNAASFSSVKFFDAGGNSHQINSALGYISNCYRVSDFEHDGFFYGGPGNFC